MYSVNDMETSTNAYQQQGDRSSVYIYLIGILAILGIYFLFNSKIYLFSPLKPLLAMIAWVFADNFILGNFFNSSRWTSLTHFGLVVWWYLAIVFGYSYIRGNQYKEKQLTVLVYLMFIYYCYQFVSVAIESNMTYDETAVLNLVYRIIVFVPFIYMLNNKWLKRISFAFVFIFTVISMKRGAIIVLPFMFLSASLMNRNKKKNVVKSIVSFVLLASVSIVFFEVINNITNGFLAERFSWESLLDGSSRSEKYATAIEEIKRRGVKSLFLGVGSGKRPGIHNEVLEFIYSFGLIGLCTYLAFLASMLYRLIKLYKAKSQYASVYGMILTFIFVVGLYSGVCFTHSTFYIMLTLGIIEYRIKEEQGICASTLV